MRDRWGKKSCVSAACVARAVVGDWCGRHDPARYHITHLPSAPLIKLVEAQGGLSGLTTDAGLRRAYGRAKRDGRLTEMAADRLALLVLNRPPWDVWGEWFAYEETSDGASSGLSLRSGNVGA